MKKLKDLLAAVVFFIEIFKSSIAHTSSFLAIIGFLILRISPDNGKLYIIGFLQAPMESNIVSISGTWSQEDDINKILVMSPTMPMQNIMLLLTCNSSDTENITCYYSCSIISLTTKIVHTEIVFVQESYQGIINYPSRAK